MTSRLRSRTFHEPGDEAPPAVPRHRRTARRQPSGGRLEGRQEDRLPFAEEQLSPLAAAVAPLERRQKQRAGMTMRNVDHERVVKTLFPEGSMMRSFSFRFAALMTLSTAIAVQGLLADSTAVVIGAMLVAPLMLPVLGVAAAMVMGWRRRLLRQGLVAFLGSAGAVGLAYLGSFLMPGTPDPLPGEVLARTSPNLLDLGIALAAGAAGAYAQVHRQASDALTGVAVAVALVPPLASVGILIEVGRYDLAQGGLLLFLANVTGIILAAALTFIACRFVPVREAVGGNSNFSRGLRWAVLGVLAVALPLQFGRGPLTPARDVTPDVMAAVDDFMDLRSPDTEVVEVSVDAHSGDVVDVQVMVADPEDQESGALDADVLAEYLAEEFERPMSVGLQVIEARADQATVAVPGED
ncbi:MAG: DUF389 domain-containing protein [Actinomycetota bacterium]